MSRSARSSTTTSPLAEFDSAGPRDDPYEIAVGPDPCRRDRVRPLPLPRRRRPDPARRRSPFLQAPRARAGGRGHRRSRDGLAVRRRAPARRAGSTNAVAYAHACEDALGLAPDRRSWRGPARSCSSSSGSGTRSTTSPPSAPASASPPGQPLRRARRGRAAAERRARPATASCSARSRSAAAHSTWTSEPSARRARALARASATTSSRAWRELLFNGSFMDRLPDIGVVDAPTALARSAPSGLAARAAGVDDDVRATSPRLAYEGFEPAVLRAPPATSRHVSSSARSSSCQRFDLLDALLAGPSDPRRPAHGRGRRRSGSAESRARAARPPASSSATATASGGSGCAPAPTRTGPPSPTPRRTTCCPTSR